MYKLSVPFMLEQVNKYGIEPFIDVLKKLKADIVFLALDSYILDPKKQEAVFSTLSDAVATMKAAGFTVGVWVWTFMIREPNDFVHITSPTGKISSMQVCPSDPEFVRFAGEYMRQIAATKPDMIMFDDDFRYGFLDCGLGCTCRNHRAYIEDLIGEPLPAGNLNQLIFAGGKSKYRSAFLKANGHFLREFAKSSRAAVDSIDPNIRLGLCACMTTWDFDGVSAAELSRILAGNTKPFLRLIGAPYWANERHWGNRLQDVIELERMESSWCGEGIEILAEGDAYPRPRFTCSANMLEGFDMAIRASGATSGIHKYPLDYSADPSYETGYVKKHLQNSRLYSAIDTYFSGKSPVGIRVYEQRDKFENMLVPPHLSGRDAVQDTFFSSAARMLAAQSIPTVYEGTGVAGIAFGENAKYLDDEVLSGVMILDATAAAILTERGVDVGLENLGASISVTEEYFPSKKRYVGLFDCPAFEIAVKEGASVLSYFICSDKKCVGSYTYVNNSGQKFLVFAFDGYRMNAHAAKQYARGEEIIKALSTMGVTLPASMSANPDCYLLAKRGDGELAVWIGNFFTDECMNTTVTLDRSYREITFIGTDGVMQGNEVHLTSIPPYASVGFCVKE